jgi:hypothetical protein
MIGALLRLEDIHTLLNRQGQTVAPRRARWGAIGSEVFTSLSSASAGQRSRSNECERYDGALTYGCADNRDA